MAGAGAGRLPPRAPLGHGGLLIPVLPLCCEDPGWAQARRPSGRFWACVRKGVCVQFGPLYVLSVDLSHLCQTHPAVGLSWAPETAGSPLYPHL